MANKWKKLAALAVGSVMTATCFAGLAACANNIEFPDGYTYRVATNSLPTAWNVHTYESNTATDVLNYTEDGFYTFDYNETKDGYKIVPAMAKEMPVDVTSEYVGAEWGISSGDTWKAVRVNLREDLYFDNGDHITAQDFVDSIELLLNPEAANYRADSVYGGQFSIVNAEKFAKSGLTVWEDVTGGEGVYLDAEWGNVDADLANELTFVAKNAFVYNYLVELGYEGYEPAFLLARLLGETIEQEDVEALEGKTLAEILADDTMSATLDELLEGWCTDPGEEFGFFCIAVTWDETAFESVGVKAVNDYTLDFILEKELSGFYLNYNLTSSMYLVNTKLYKECMGESAGAYTNNYGTSVSTYVGFGPYRLSHFVADSVAMFERNPYWYGYNDEENEGLYQTSNITIQQVSEASTRLQMFLAGELDSYGLQAADMDDYQSSQFTYYTEGDSTWFIALNPDMAGLSAAQEAATPSASGKVVNKTVLTVKEFRQALSFSVDRAAYELALDPVGSVAKSLYGNMIISDPENGVAYRTTDEAKQVIVRFWGLEDEIGEGKEYATIDDAIASITGYDPSGAKVLFDAAYAKAVEQGLIDPSTDWEVQIMIGQPGSGSSAYYNDGYEFLKKTWEEAVVGTEFEGRLVFTQSQPLGSTDFADYLQNNSIDLLFGVGWTGSALDPYNLMEAYVSPNYQYDPGWDTTTTMLDVEWNGQTLRASVYAWGKDALQGNEIEARVVDADGNVTSETVKISAGTTADPTLRLKILAAVEGAVLEQYDMIPVGLEATANLKGMRIQYYTEEYVYGMGRGGIKYMTYKMNDAEWKDYVKEQGGELNYK